MTDMEAKELLGMCMGECKRQAVDTAKQTVRTRPSAASAVSLRDRSTIGPVAGQPRVLDQ